MNPEKTPWLRVAAAASFLCIGVPYWIIPYNKINLPDALLGPGLLVVAAGALLVRVKGAAPFWRGTWILMAMVPAAVMARVIVDGVRDPTSHNLWPLEVIIALLAGLVCALAGSVLGAVIARVRGDLQGRGDQ
jgi:hypothetical protein